MNFTGTVTAATQNLNDAGSPEDGTRRYFEGRIEPGDTVYVRGRVDRAGAVVDDGSIDPDRLIVTPVGDEPLIVSKRTEADLLAATADGKRDIAYDVGQLVLAVAVAILFL